MPDTPEDPSVELVPEQRSKDDDDATAARERRARAEAGKHPTHTLAEEEDDAERREEEDAQARLDEADEVAHDERLELAAKEEQLLQEERDRHKVAEATRAREIAFADDAATKAAQYRGLAATGQQRELGLLARGQHKQDEAAARPDEPGSAELGAEGRRNVRASQLEGYQVNADRDRARAYDDLDQEHGANARQAQPDPVEAVRTPPGTAPDAQPPLARRHVRGPKSRQRNLQRKKQQQSDIPDLEI
jgi:hypothetical protein